MTTKSEASVLVLGGGYAGIRVAKGLDPIAAVTLVDPAEAFHHNVAALRALVEPDWLDRIFFPYDRLLARGTVLRDRAVAVEGRRVTLASGAVPEPDYLILATGSAYPYPHKREVTGTEEARSQVRRSHADLRAADRVLLVGAGPVGLELAGEIMAAFPAKKVTIVDVAPDILTGPFDPALRDEVRAQLEKLGVELVLGSPLRSLPDAPPAVATPLTVTTEAGDTVTADIWYRCFGVAPQTGYLRGAPLDPRGYLRVDEQLRVAAWDRVYALGDMTDADRDTAGAARRQADLVVANLTAQITGSGEPSPYQPGPAAILLPLGPDGGAGQLPGGELVGPETAAQYKGRSMMVENYVTLFDVVPADRPVEV